MKILKVESLLFPEVKRIRFARFADHRGYFTEIFKRSDFDSHPELESVRSLPLYQANESFSRRGTVRGLHFQWDRPMGKLIRTVTGRMIDLVLDIRVASPTFGKIVAIDLPATPEHDFNEWIWIPPGFAHGNCFPVDTTIQYFCTAEWNPAAEAGISPLAADIDWSVADPTLVEFVRGTLATTSLMTDKDRDGLTLAGWRETPHAAAFGVTPHG